MIERWTGRDRPLFRGSLIDAEGCYCAQGDVLHCAGFTDDQLRAMTQFNADAEVAKILGISRTHSVLLRNVTDKVGGAPQIVLSNPEQIVGDKAPLLLAFWLHLDGLSAAAWDAAVGGLARDAAVGGLARDAAWTAAWAAAGAAASGAAAGAATWAAAGAAASGAAAGAAAEAASEIQGIDILARDGKQPYFLAFFGFKTWDEVRVLVP
jgi:hypothetical protein